MSRNLRKIAQGDFVRRPDVLNRPLEDVLAESGCNTDGTNFPGFATTTGLTASQAAAQAYADQIVAEVRDLDAMQAAVDAELIGSALVRIFTGGVSRALRLDRLAGFVARSFGVYVTIDPKFAADPTGSADAVAAIQAACDAAGTAGGGLVYNTPGTFKLLSAVSVPTKVDFLGASKYSTIFACGPLGAIRFGSGGGTATVENYGGRSGHFRMTATASTVPMLYVGLCVARTFASIDINGGNGGSGDGLRLEQTQNCHFVEVDAQRCGGSGVVLDYGAGGNLFSKCEFYRNGYANGRSTYTGANTGGGYSYVQHNTFDTCLFEGTTATMVAVFEHGAGARCVFRDCHLTQFSGTTGHADLYGTDIPTLRVYKIASAPVSHRVFLTGSTTIFGSAPSAGVVYRGYGIQVENSPGSPQGLNVYIDNGVLVDSCKSALYVSDLSQIEAGTFVVNNCTTRYTSFGGTGTEATTVTRRTGSQTITGVDPASVQHTVRAATGQTAHVAEWYGTSGLIAYVTNAGSLVLVSDINANLSKTGSRGTVGAPAYSFTNDTDCGLYSPTTNEIALATNGAKRIHLGANGEVHFAGGTPVAKPTLNAAATDLASVIALTNQIRAALIANGIAQ